MLGLLLIRFSPLSELLILCCALWALFTHRKRSIQKAKQIQIMNQYMSDLLYQLFWTIFIFELLHHLVKHLRRRSHCLSHLFQLIVAHVFLV